VQERLALIPADRWIEDEQGGHVFQVDEMAMAKLNAFILRDLHGGEVARLQHADLQEQDATDIMRQGTRLATVRRARAGLRHHYAIGTADGGSLEVHGHVGRYDYEIRRAGDIVAAVSRNWFRAHDAYGVEVGTGEDEAMLVAAAIAIETMHIG
jgi:uncharacterized protein YxjI